MLANTERVKTWLSALQVGALLQLLHLHLFKCVAAV